MKKEELDLNRGTVNIPKTADYIKVMVRNTQPHGNTGGWWCWKAVQTATNLVADISCSTILTWKDLSKGLASLGGFPPLFPRRFFLHLSLGTKTALSPGHETWLSTSSAQATGSLARLQLLTASQKNQLSSRVHCTAAGLRAKLIPSGQQITEAPNTYRNT